MPFHSNPTLVSSTVNANATFPHLGISKWRTASRKTNFKLASVLITLQHDVMHVVSDRFRRKHGLQQTLMFKLIQYISFKLFMQLGFPYAAVIITLISYL